MRPLPAPTLARRQASVQRTDQGVSAYLTSPSGMRTTTIPDTRYLTTYLDWQWHAKRAGHQVGIVRFAGGVTADTVSRCEAFVEVRVGNEWERADDPRLTNLLAEYSNPRQSTQELVHAHAWHYSIAGESFQTMSQGDNGVDWGIWSKAALAFDKPEPGLVTVRMAPDAKPTDQGALFVVPREQVTRFWNPDEEWQAYATSPIVASIDDIRRWETLARYAQMTAQSQLAMNGMLWWADDGWDLYDSEDVDTAADEVGAAGTRQENQYFEIARLRFTGAGDIAAVAPNLVHGPKDNGPPTWVKTGEALDPQGIAHREEALGDFARGTNLPGSLVLGGGPGDANHWTEWLVSRAFFDQAIAPTANRVFHADLTATFLRRRLLVANYDPTLYRVGYDATPVIVSPDMSDRALRAWLSGLVSAEAAREALGFTEADAPSEADTRHLLEVLSKSATGVPTRVTLQSEPPGAANPAEPLLPAGPGTTQPGPPPSGPPGNGNTPPQAAMPPFVGASPDATPRGAEVRFAYSEEQARDDHGRFGEGAGGGQSERGHTDFDKVGATWRDNAATAAAKAEFAALPDSAQVVVYHGTTPEGAAKVESASTVSHGVHESDLPTQASDHLYVAPTRADAERYGSSVVRLVVTKGDMQASPEALRVDPNASVAKAFFNSFDGAVLPPGTAYKVTSRGAAFVGAIDGVPTRARVQRTLRQLTTLRRDLGRSLLDGATQAYEEALRQAGVRVLSRARSRGTGKATEARAREAVACGGPFGPLLAALGLRESDLLAGAFVTFAAQAEAKLRAYKAKQVDLIAALNIDPNDFLSLDDQEATDAAAFLVAGLLATARQRLLHGVAENDLFEDGQPALPGEVTGPIPARYVTDAIRLAEGRSLEHRGATPDHAPTTSPAVGARSTVHATTPAGDTVAVELPQANSVEEGLADYFAQASGGGVMYEWVHGFYGDPLRSFEPHEALNGYATPDIDTDPELANGEGWPDVDYFMPGDHDGCTCEWVPSLTEPSEVGA